MQILLYKEASQNKIPITVKHGKLCTQDFRHKPCNFKNKVNNIIGSLKISKNKEKINWGSN